MRLQLARNENHAARHGIDKLLGDYPRRPGVLRLAEQAYTQRVEFTAGYPAVNGKKPTSAMKSTAPRWSSRPGLA